MSDKHSLNSNGTVVELVDTGDLKSPGPKRPCGFESRPCYKNGMTCLYDRYGKGLFEAKKTLMLSGSTIQGYKISDSVTVACGLITTQKRNAEV